MDTPNIATQLDLNDFVEATNLNGVVQSIPAAWLDDPYIGRGFSLTPRQVALDARAGDYPEESWTKDHLLEFATAKHIPVSDGANKPEIWKAVNSVLVAGEATLTQVEAFGPDPLATSDVASLQSTLAEKDSLIESLRLQNAELEARLAPEPEPTDPEATTATETTEEI